MTSCCLFPTPPSPLNGVWKLLYADEHWRFLPRQLDSDKTFSITLVTTVNHLRRFPWLLGTLWNVTQPCPTKLLLLVDRSLMQNLQWTWWCKHQSLQTKEVASRVFFYMFNIWYVQQFSPLARCVFHVAWHLHSLRQRFHGTSKNITISESRCKILLL